MANEKEFVAIEIPLPPPGVPDRNGNIFDFNTLSLPTVLVTHVDKEDMRRFAEELKGFDLDRISMGVASSIPNTPKTP